MTKPKKRNRRFTEMELAKAWDKSLAGVRINCVGKSFDSVSYAILIKALRAEILVQDMKDEVGDV